MSLVENLEAKLNCQCIEVQRTEPTLGGQNFSKEKTEMVSVCFHCALYTCALYTLF